MLLASVKETLEGVFRSVSFPTVLRPSAHNIARYIAFFKHFAAFVVVLFGRNS